ncbi:hypothetical protein CBI30_03910 [Polynucleobacter aenigmaticus]|uniref:Arabinose-5-phosphate isomerase n=1 Tax=Polynucleobacter aenigmaticus TaxID=1743164 RepID=A0A254Q0G8_9BURK|nr:KpsF/GutQ family sugar-phosphate isomerase [Polynucleobacter aenigmaticus]OWS71988.1 hypothetical protein CBI30_03910 [Polynucleobacter aenigmaticus]
MNSFNAVQVAREVLNIEIDALKHSCDSIGEEFIRAVNILSQASRSGRIIVMGMGKSGHVGKKMAATLASTGSPAFFVHPAEAGHGDLGMITKFDVVIAISQSGKSEELLRVIPYFKRNQIKLIAMTADLLSPLANFADEVICTDVPKEACPLGLAPTASTTLVLALGDALAICLLKKSNFKESDFAETHPHGALGRRLLLGVRDVMSEINDDLFVLPSTVIKAALIKMSRGEMGFIIVVDSDHRPIGVFTDGDLRRCLDRDIDIKTTQISDVMSCTFVSINHNQLAVAAVSLMELSKVSALPVLDQQGQLMGVISMRQLLQAGVV